MASVDLYTLTFIYISVFGVFVGNFLLLLLDVSGSEFISQFSTCHANRAHMPYLKHTHTHLISPIMFFCAFCFYMGITVRPVYTYDMTFAIVVSLNDSTIISRRTHPVPISVTFTISERFVDRLIIVNTPKAFLPFCLIHFIRFVSFTQIVYTHVLRGLCSVWNGLRFVALT